MSTLAVTPKFLAYNLPHANEIDEHVIRKRLLRSANHKRNGEIAKLHKEHMTLDTKIHNATSALEYYTLSRTIAANVAKVSSNVFKTHEKKMVFIGRVLDYVEPFIKFDHPRVRLHMRLGHEN